MTKILLTPITTQTYWEEKVLGEKCVIKSRKRTKDIHNHPEKIKTTDNSDPFIIFSFDLDNTLIYTPETLGEKEKYLQENDMYEKIYTDKLTEYIHTSLKKFISSPIPMLPVLVTSSTLNRVDDILDTESTNNFLQDIFTPEQIFARGTFNPDNPLKDIKKQNPDYSDKFIQKLQERGLIAKKDNIHIIHFGDKTHDETFITHLKQYSQNASCSVKITGEYSPINLKKALLETDKENAEIFITNSIIQKINDIYHDCETKFNIIKNKKPFSKEASSSSAEKMES